MKAPLPSDEKERLAVLHEHQILDTAPEEEFDDLVRLAAHVCGVPIAAVSLIDEHRQWFKSIVGLAATETPREEAFCAHTILNAELMVVPDAQADPRFADNPSVTGDSKIRFYAGMPLFTDEGYSLGSLCVIDRIPRQLTFEQEETLRLLASQVTSHLRAARRVAEREHLVAEKERLIAEGKRAEETIETERVFQQALLESLQEGIVACDAQGTLTLFNRATREFHGLPEQPLPPEQWSEHFDLYQADGMSPLPIEDIPLFRAFEGEIVREAEMVIAPKDGPTRILLASGQAIFGVDGKKLGAVVAMHDVTERRQVERENGRLASIVESSSEAILGVTLDGTLVSWNQGAERLYGYRASEMLGQHASVLAQAHEKGLIQKVITRLIHGETVDSMEVIRIRRDGTLVNVSLSFSSIRDAGGKTIGISCISRDITDRKKIEIALIESENRLRRLSDAAFDGIAISQGGVLVDVSMAFAAEFGYGEPAQMIGLAVNGLTTPDSLALLLQKIASCDEEPYEATLRRRDGTTFLAEVRGRQMQLGGKPARVTAVRNVTHQKEMERDLHERAERLRQSDAALRAVLESAPVILYAVNAHGIVTLSEGTGLAALGLTPGEVVGRSIFTFNNDPELEANARRALAGEAVSYDACYIGLCLHTVLTPLLGVDGSPAGFIGVCFDVTERVASEERFRVLFEQSSHAHLLFDETGGILDCNAAALTMMHCTDKALLLGTHPAHLSPEFQPDGRCSVEKGAEMCALARQNGSHRFEWQRRALDGYEYPIEVTLTPVVLGGRPVLLSVWHDLTERKQQEERIRDHAVVLGFQMTELETQKQELERANRQLEEANARLEDLATTDGLTGLKNHRAFQERLNEEIDRSCRYGSPLSLILLDVDHFKLYNDTFGHPAGDKVLKEVARLLGEGTRDTDIVARYGGEEFVLVLPHTGSEGALVIAERIRQAIDSAPWHLRSVTASFGVSTLKPGILGGDLIEMADQALYYSKQTGRNRISEESALAEITR